MGGELRGQVDVLMTKIIFAVLLVLTATFTVNAMNIRVDFRSELDGWEEKVFNGRVDYRVVQDADHLVLQGISGGKASALIYWQDINPVEYPKIRWRWKIDKILQKGQAGQKAGDDYPARIYIIFDSWLPNYARSINYIWASHAEPEALVVSPYYSRSVMLAVKSGDADVGRWVEEERNLFADYQRAFGDKIPLIRAVAIMTDGDDTGESSTAWYDWLEFVAAGTDL